MGREHYRLHCLTLKQADYRGKNQGYNTIVGQEPTLHMASSAPQPCISLPGSTGRENGGGGGITKSVAATAKSEWDQIWMTH